MSIVVAGLTKFYKNQKALNNISFNINSGEIVGLLGPNGAGKTTLMRIICCFIPASSGSVSVCNINILSNSLKIRQKIGYLPENNPLYLDMYVREYLYFLAGIHKISNVKSVVEEMIELTGLNAEQKKKIGSLSKGYRQRVGIAQALIHKPEVLILDEPTSGLDPNQIVEIRHLIKNIGKEKTILISTHIMQEVEAICDRAIIINKGDIIKDDLTANLHNLSSLKQIIIVEFGSKVSFDLLSKMDDAIIVNYINNNVWEIISDKIEDLRPIVFNFAVKNNLTIVSLQKKEHSIEDVFRQLTTS
ncbi:MAG: gliding motility-associated ABC transporter ATP-binding subunit GldA [Bacteroidales bacterium]|nr:gliding motility-associated ABC transporter ATP-binding subunit GldA [Bacteroidales bacterium]